VYITINIKDLRFIN